MSSGRKWSTAIFLAVLFTAAAVACARDEVRLQPVSMTAVPVRGTVTLPDGSPARNARLELAVWGRDYVEATTDAAGRYSAMLPDAGAQVVEARIRGVGVSKRLVVRPPDASRDVRLDIDLYAAPVLTGVIYTQRGAPAANITLERYGIVRREKNVPPADGIPPEQPNQGGGGCGGSTEPAITTDNLGRYSIPLLDLNQEITGWPPPDVPADGTEHKQYLISLSGLGWAKLEVRVDLDLVEVHRDVHLRPGARVSGALIGYPGGTALAGVRVQIGVDHPATRHGWFTVEEPVTDEEGQFQGSAALPPDVLFVHPLIPRDRAIMNEEWQPAGRTAAGDRHVTISVIRDSTIEGGLFAPDGMPLADAHVVFPDVAEVDTDGEGRYQLELKAGFTAYGLPAHRPRHVWLAPRVPGVGVAAPVRVDVSQEPLSYDFRLSPPATVVGKQVERDEGVPAVGVRASLVPVIEGVPVEELSRLWGLCLDEQQSVRKNDETGEFRLEGVPAGDYWLEATGWTIHELTAEKGNAPRVTVPPGGTVRVDTLHVGYVPRLSVELMRRPSDLGSYEVTGFIRPAGSSGPGEQIFVWHEGGDRYTVWAYRIWSRALCPGRYDIVIASRKEASRYVSELHTMDLTADPPKGEASFELGGGSVRGRVVMPDGETGVPRITVTARAMAGEAVILNGRGHDWGHMQTDTDAEGGFTIPGLLPGDYELRAHLPEEFYGPQPTLRFALSVNEQAAVLLRAEHAVW